MTHRGWLLSVLVLLVSASLSGCLGGDDDPAPTDDDTGDASDGGDTTDDGNNTDDGSDGDVDVNVTTSAPQAAFEIAGGNTTFAVGENVSLDASTTVDNDTAVENLTFSWDFGDGNTAEGMNATHTFAEVGNYTIVLNVTDPDGNSGAANITISVESGFEEGVITELTGSTTLPNPIVHNAGGGYNVLNGVCGTNLECYTTFGGVEGTHYNLHEIEIPEGPGKVVLDGGEFDATATISIAVFHADGGRIGSTSAGASTSAPVVTMSDPSRFVGTLTVFVASPLSANASYTITVTGLEE